MGKEGLVQRHRYWNGCGNLESRKPSISVLKEGVRKRTRENEISELGKSKVV